MTAVPTVPAASAPPAAPPAPDRDPGTSLTDLGLPPDLVAAAHDLGWSEPTPVQAASVPPLLEGRDLVGVAQTGTGKTGAFALPLLARVSAERRTQALVLTPTRELALQVADAVRGLARHTGTQVAAVHGGAPYGPQQRALAAGAQVVVGTPGRLIDHLDRGSLDLSDVHVVVLDEADEMLRMGFAEDVERVLRDVPAGRQVALFSATMPPAIRRVAAQHLTDPVRVTTDRQSSTVDTTRQTYAVVPHRHKIGALARVLATTEADATIVFTKTRARADEVGSALVARGLRSATISGDVAQADRERVVARLRDGTVDVVVATDVAARGLDVDRVGLVVNLDVPTEPESYVHRVGRTGRAGRTGEALTFVTPSEQHRLRAIERATGRRLEEVAVPTPAEVAAHRATALLAQVDDRLSAGRLEEHRRAVVEHLSATGRDPLDVAVALVALATEPARGSAEAADAVADVSAAGHHGRTRDDGGRERARARRERISGTRYRVAVGHAHGVGPNAIVGALTGEGGLNGSEVGKIDVFPSFSLVEVATELRPETLRRVGAARVAGRPLRIAVDTGPPSRSGVTDRRPRPHAPRASRAGS